MLLKVLIYWKYSYIITVHKRCFSSIYKYNGFVGYIDLNLDTISDVWEC